MNDYRFTLYLAGGGHQSLRAQRDLRRLCEQRLARDDYEIDVVDVLDDVDAADAARILVTPTIVRSRPLPPVRVIGGVSVSDRLADALGHPGDADGGHS
jgi:circadian clock protein KaiB